MAEKQEYDHAVTQHQIVLLAGLIKELDLEEFIYQIEKSEALGPLLHPEMFISQPGFEKLNQVKRLAKAAKVFQDEVFLQIEKETKKIEK